MIRSMTGFGRSEYVDEDKKIAIEIKSVNHRYSDINIKMPRKFNQFEAAMRTVLKDYIERGKVDVFVTYEDYAKSNLVVKYNKEIAAEYIGHLEQMKQELGSLFDIENCSHGELQAMSVQVNHYMKS